MSTQHYEIVLATRSSYIFGDRYNLGRLHGS
jgi:hypothetical protein